MKELFQDNVLVRHKDSIDRAHRLGFTHPNGEWELVEYFLSRGGVRVEWVRTNQIAPTLFKQPLTGMNTPPRTHINVEYLTKHHYKIPSETPIDYWGYAYLQPSEMDTLWETLKRNM